MAISAESLLIRPSRVIDPFNRLGCTISPMLTVVEFCQIIGPQPLATVTHNADDAPSNHVDMDQLAVWLMSSETASGTALMIYNQQMGIYALSYHTTIYDIRARAFQRPLCIAYLTSDKPSGDLLLRFTASARRLLTPLVVCNRRVFLKQLNDMITISDAIGYYSLHCEDGSRQPLCSQKLLNVAEQARRLRPKMQAMYEGLSLSENIDSECMGHNDEPLDSPEDVLGSFRAQTPLEPIKSLAPCTCDNFINGLKPVLNHLSERTRSRGVLYSAHTPVLRLAKYESPLKVKNTASVEDEEAKNEESLRTLLHLDHLMYSVWAGNNIWVCGSEQRRNTVIDLTRKLNVLAPRTHIPPTNLWTEVTHAYASGIVGLCASRRESQSFAEKQKGTVILDTNASVLKAVPYQGVLLHALKHKRKFPSDGALMRWLAAIASNICQIVYMGRYVNPLGMTEEGLSSDDERLLVKLLCELDLLRYQGLNGAVSFRSPENAQMKTYSL